MGEGLDEDIVLLRRPMRRLRSVSVAAMSVAALLWASTAQAGVYGSGKIAQLVVGRLQTQVFIDVAGGTQTDWPCPTTNPNGLNYAFDMNRPGAQALLSLLETAFASRSTITAVGSGNCTVARHGGRQLPLARQMTVK